jgi:hypothetical protein
VTVEAAISLLGVAIVMAVLVWLLVVLDAQLRAGDAARGADRVAARAQPYVDVVAEAHRISPGAAVDVSRLPGRTGERVVVVVRRTISAPLGPLASIGTVEVSSRATALLESP